MKIEYAVDWFDMCHQIETISKLIDECRDKNLRDMLIDHLNALFSLQLARAETVYVSDDENTSIHQLSEDELNTQYVDEYLDKMKVNNPKPEPPAPPPMRSINENAPFLGGNKDSQNTKDDEK